MKIRYGLVLALAVLFGITGCASGGGGGSTGSTGAAGLVGAGERPRNSDNTRAAQRLLDDADEAEDPAERRSLCEQALAGANAEIAADPTNPLGHRQAALASLCLEDYQAAGRHFDEAAELNELYALEDETLRERTWIDLYQVAGPLVNAGDYEGAVVAFENAQAIFQGRPEAITILAQLHAQLRNHDAAITAMDESFAFLDSEYMLTQDSATTADWTASIEELRPLRANVLADAGRFEEAVVAYRELADLDPTNLRYLQDMAIVLQQMGNDAEALEVYGELLERPGLGGSDYYSIGVGYYQANDYANAARAFSGAAGVSENDRDALEMWSRSLMLDSLWAEIPPVAERWVELDPYSQNGYLILAQSANQSGDQQTTADAIQRAEALTVAVDQLQLRRFPTGGGTIGGSVINKTLDAGSNVTLRFTFFSDSGDPIGSVTQTVSVGEADMAQVFSVDFDSAEYVGGYGYTLTVG